MLTQTRRPPLSRTRYFTNGTFRFLRELAAHNERAWFDAHRADYAARIKDPALRFIQDFAPHLKRLSPHFSAGPRSLFRIHRDTRFSKDKSPYKTHTGIQFRHDLGRDAHAPGFYLHIEPSHCFAGLGLWHPDSATLRKIRDHIVEEPVAWKRASRAARFREIFEMQGDRLRRAPRGYDPEHPLVEDLKWKDFIGMRSLPQSFVTAPDLPERLAEVYRAGRGFMRFLCAALGVPF